MRKAAKAISVVLIAIGSFYTFFSAVSVILTMTNFKWFIKPVEEFISFSLTAQQQQEIKVNLLKWDFAFFGLGVVLVVLGAFLFKVARK